MNLDEIVKDVLSKMGSGTGLARNSAVLFTEVLKTHPNLIGKQKEINAAIDKLIGSNQILQSPNGRLQLN